jgi:sugar/nucleoside kinase (ribokinase family)
LKKIIFGIGTGRCGTQSLAALLNEQVGADYFSHEYGRTWTRWGVDTHFIYRIISNLSARSGSIVGDVSFYHLPNIEAILSLRGDRDIKRNINFRVICLKIITMSMDNGILCIPSMIYQKKKLSGNIMMTIML